jgi:hypothetical protein
LSNWNQFIQVSLKLVDSTTYSIFIRYTLFNQCGLNEWACWAVAQGPNEHRVPMLIYVWCVQHVFNDKTLILLEIPIQ